MEVWHLYTDGACQPNPGSGGWAFILHHQTSANASSVGDQVARRGICRDTTNNRMEMQAVIEGLRYFVLENSHEEYELVLFSDSLYLVDGIEQWSDRWASNGWMKKNGEPVLNQDLWDEIRLLKRHLNIKCVHVKGHSGDDLNERVDKLASRSATQAQRIYHKEECPSGRTEKTQDPLLFVR